MARYISLNTTILKETREKRRHTQESLAQAVGIARETYSRLESTGSTQVVTAEKIADELVVDLDHLTGIKRGDTMFSPFACECLCPGKAGSEPERRLFDTEWELLEFIESRITAERPVLDDGLFLESSNKPVPGYSCAPDGRYAEFKLPLRGGKGGFDSFIFRELEYRESQGFVWRKLTKWARLTIENRLQQVLNRYWPDYCFNGQSPGANAEFRVTLTEGPEGSPCQTLVLQDFPVLMQFSNWLARRLPKSAASPFGEMSAIHLFLFFGASAFAKIAILRVDRDSERLAPFPDEWQEAVMRQLNLVGAQEVWCSENGRLPNISDFAERVQEIKSRAEKVNKTAQ